MAEVKNSFLSSKMNKDLDDRLVPNNEYRDALNVLVGKSESSDVGVLQTIPGNELAGSTGNPYLTCIGRIVDNLNNRIIEFLTNYKDPLPNSIVQVPNPFSTFLSTQATAGQTTLILSSVDSTVKAGQTFRATPYSAYYPYENIHTIIDVQGNTITIDSPLQQTISITTPIFIEYSMKIVVYSTSSSVVKTLTSGIFLNFANNNEFTITGVNIIDDLLFWVDNRNQPRKININTALIDSRYYYSEDQISVAKYNPMHPISLFNNTIVTATSNGTNDSFGNKYFTTSLVDGKLLSVGMQLIKNSTNIDSYCIINNIVLGVSSATITITSQSTTISTSDKLSFFKTTMTDNSNEIDWKGDSSFLKNKYVRFSYRYKFIDGEYSLIAPFTQIIYIPTQKGYFFNQDEENAFTSTVLSFMENYVNSALFYIQLPTSSDLIVNDYLIDKIEILYKESNSINIKVLDSIDSTTIQSVAINSNIYTYQYSSQKPYKTLPESQTVRVYDKVPIRAKAQEVTGNRVIYGNFISSNTAPTSINYNISVNQKSSTYDSWVEYPNHTLKQNRTYQIGIVLADKFGRQSSVVLSGSNKQSTIYAPFISNDIAARAWVGNSLNMTFNEVISSNKSEASGEPGLYAIISGSIPDDTNGFQVISPTYVYSAPGYGKGSYNNALSITLSTGSTDPKNKPILGGYLRGEYVDYVKIISNPSGNIYIADGVISSRYNFDASLVKDIKYAYSINQLGWYSYKIVVKQQQQDYYNVYLPGMLNGYPSYQTSGTSGGNPSTFPQNEIDRIAHTVLINDNINKVPRDLIEVGPDQKQYRSSTNMFCRVQNIVSNNISYNTQYYSTEKADVVSTIATAGELNFLPFDSTTNVHGTAGLNFYQLDTNPLIARISTIDSVGVLAAPIVIQGSSLYTNLMTPKFSVYETNAESSLLDIYWESTTTGYISDINEDILISRSANIIDLKNINFSFSENQNFLGTGTGTGASTSPYITGYFYATNNGIPIVSSTITMYVVDMTNSVVTGNFIITRYPAGIAVPTGETFAYDTYRIKIFTNFVFTKDYDKYSTFDFSFNITNTSNQANDYKIIHNIVLSNDPPIITIPSTDNTTITLATNAPDGGFYQLLGNNGSNSLSQDGLAWTVFAVSPTSGSNFSIKKDTGVLSNKITTSGTYTVSIKLTDAYNYTLNSPISESLDTIRIINFKNDNYFNSNYYGNGFRYSSSGGKYWYMKLNIDIWRSLWPGEYIDDLSSKNITVEYLPYASPLGTIWYSAPNLTITIGDPYNNSTYSLTMNTPTAGYPTSDPRSNIPKTIRLKGTITTSLGRVLNIKPSTSPGDDWYYASYILTNSNDTATLVNSNSTYRPDMAIARNFTIKNNSNNISWWSALGGLYADNNVIGSFINPGDTQTFVGDNACVVKDSIYGEPGVSFTITYGSSGCY